MNWRSTAGLVLSFFGLDIVAEARVSFVLGDATPATSPVGADGDDQADLAGVAIGATDSKTSATG